MVTITETLQNINGGIMKILTTITLISLALTTSAYAEKLKGGYGACITEDLFDQLVSAAVKKDEHAYQYLMKNGCIITKAGIQITVLDRTWTGKAKVRAYVGSSVIELWTNIENIHK